MPPLQVSKPLLRAILIAAFATTAATRDAAADTSTTGFLIVNPWLDDSSSGFPLDPPDGVGWTFNTPWEFEDSLISFLGAALFPTTSGNPVGVHTAEASAVDLTTPANIASLDGYDPSTTRLTGLTFELPWRVGHFGTVPQDGEYDLFMEFTIDTPNGSYRASTNRLDRPTAFQNTIAQLPFTFTWETGGFLGDPFAGGGGIPLDQITNIDYQMLVEVINPTSGGDGFFNAEGFNILYEVSSAATTGVQGDFNGDGTVNLADYTVWRDNLGAADESPIMGAGDGLNGVDVGDYALWKSNFGSGALGSARVAEQHTVPEPATITALIVTLLLLPACRGRRA